MMIRIVRVQIANNTMNNLFAIIMFMKDYCLCESQHYDEIITKNNKKNKNHITWFIGNEKLNS